MTEDTRDYIEQTQSRSVDYNGRELSPAEMATEFAKCDIDARVTALQSITSDDGPQSISEAANFLFATRQLRLPKVDTLCTEQLISARDGR